MTAPERRPASSYVAHEGDVLVPAWFVSWLDTQVNLQRLRVRAAEFGPQHVAVVVALLFSSASATAPAASGGGRKNVAAAPEVPAPSEVMSATQVADALGISPRAVRLACSEGRLPAHRVDAEWRITRTDLEHYRRRRAA